MGILKFMLITLLVIWFVGLVIRAAFSRFLRKSTEAYNQAVRDARHQVRQKKRGTREGEVTVEARESSVKVVSSDVGDYVEFEEITEVTSGPGSDEQR